jgi:cytochrome c553
MKKILKWITIALIVLITLTALASVALYFVGMEKFTRTYPNIAVEQIKISVDANAIARGKHIATIWSCTRCHGDNLSGTVITNDPISGLVPILGSIPASNLTAGNGGIANSYTDADWVRAIRHGVTPNGRVEILMNDYSILSDRDLGDLIAYLKQIPPVDSDQSARSYGPLLPIFPAIGLFTPAADAMDHNAPRPTDPALGATKEYGKYLVGICTGCHNKAIANGLSKWSREDFVRAFRSGVLPNGTRFGSTMSSKTFSEMNDTELSALWLYMQNTSPTQAQK